MPTMDETETASAEELVRIGISRAPSLPALREVAAGCHACPLWRRATQTVFGEGAARARVMLVGEQPGDQEDRHGRPFVGPAGRILDQGLEDAGIDRHSTYVTNAVKHFKWTDTNPRDRAGTPAAAAAAAAVASRAASAPERGKRRIHQKPNALEIGACRPWLLAEIDLVKPEVLVCLGATAAQSLLGRTFKVTQHRGEMLASPYAPHVVATVHPSSILRARDEESRHREMRRFVADLEIVAAFLRRH
jgi:uracil-DNA glycosylase